MEDFEESIKNILTETIETLTNKSIEVESVIGLYYIKLYLNDNILSNENKFIVDRIFFLLQKDEYQKYFSLDIRFLVTWFLIRSIKDSSLEKEITEEFFSVYLVFDKFQNIIDNVDIIKMIFPQDKLEKYLDELYKAILRRNDFFDLSLIEKEKTIYKYHYMTVMLYERSEKPFKKMFQNLYKLFLEAIEKKDDEIVFYIYAPLQFSWNGVSTTQDEYKTFNERVEKVLEQYIRNNMIKKYKVKDNNKILNKNKPIKVAFLQERLINYSIYKVLYSLLKNLNEENNAKYEFIILNLNFTELGGSIPEVENLTNELGFEYINCHELLMEDNGPFYSVVNKSLELRDLILNKEIDILIGMHSRAEYNFLFTTRVCPIQIYWSHGNFEYNLENIDKVISHFKAPTNKKDINKFTLPISFDSYNPIVDKKEIINIKNRYPKEFFILGYIGRLVKIEDDKYLNVVSEIMKLNKNTIFLACGSGDQSKIKQKINELGIADRFYFTGHINSHVYAHIIDLYLSSFINGGEALQEYIYKEKPFVFKINSNDKTIEDYKNVDILNRIKDKDLNYVYSELYTLDNLESLKNKDYLYSENKCFKTYSLLQSVISDEDYINVASLFVRNYKIAKKAAKEYTHKARYKNKLSGFFEVLG